MPTMRIFRYDISLWFFIGLAVIGVGAWLFVRSKKAAKIKAEAEAAAKAKASGATENKKFRQDITVPGAGVLSVDVDAPL